MVEDLAAYLETKSPSLRAVVRCSDAEWNRQIRKLSQFLTIRPTALRDETVWSFLVAVGYGMAGDEGVAKLCESVVGRGVATPNDPAIWFEAQPMSPRLRESNTHVDLALGHIRSRGTTMAGIELDPAPASWVCLVEAKWFSDASPLVTHDPERTQLARVAENALTFQAEGEIAESVFVGLMTPMRFRDSPVKSRLYQYQFREFQTDSLSLLDDFKAIDDSLPRRNQHNWCYPDDLEIQLRLGLRWVTYEDLLSSLPPSPIREPLMEILSEHGDSWSTKDGDGRG